MRGLVISGGGSKGAFAGGVAQFLLEEAKNEYDILVGTSTGSLLVPHLALGKVDKIKRVCTTITQDSIFSKCPFKVIHKGGNTDIRMNPYGILKNLIQGSRTFGESHNLRKLIKREFTQSEFDEIKNSNKEVVVTVANISKNTVEYKSINDFGYEDFVDWLWISCNYVPFMSMVTKGGCDYADGGLGSMVPIEEAIRRGAKEVDVIVLATEVNYYNRMPSTNPFSVLTSLIEFLLDRIEYQNIKIGKYAAVHKGAIVNLYYTPTVLTTNSLVFDVKKMEKWWESGLDYARNKSLDSELLDENYLDNP